MIFRRLEKLGRTCICRHLAEHGLTPKDQHGFLNGRSYLSNIPRFFDAVTTKQDDGKAEEVYYSDLNKAFGSVSHRPLMLKMKVFGISGELHRG